MKTSFLLYVVWSDVQLVPSQVYQFGTVYETKWQKFLIKKHYTNLPKLGVQKTVPKIKVARVGTESLLKTTFANTRKLLKRHEKWPTVVLGLYFNGRDCFSGYN